MKSYVSAICTAAALMATSVNADDYGLKDAKGWLDECVSLASTSTPMAGVMEFDCLSSAFRYCKVGRSNEYHETCQNDLAEQLKMDVSQISPFLEPAESMSEFQKTRYGKRANRIADETVEDCPDNELEKSECLLVQVGLKWLETLSLARAIELNFHEIVKSDGADN